MPFSKTSIAFVIESLGSGGAERQLIELIKHVDRERFSIRILTYTSPDYYLPDAQKANVPVFTLIRRGKWDFRPVFRLAHWLASGEVNIVHAFLSTANLYAVLAKKCARRGKVIVSERSTADNYNKTTRFMRKLVFRFAYLSVTNSTMAYRVLAHSLHLAKEKLSFIPNVVDMKRFHPVDTQMRGVLRTKFGWREGERIVLTVASFKAAKNYPGMVRSLIDFRPSDIPLRFFWLGHAEDHSLFLEIKRQIIDLGFEHLVSILELKYEVAELYCACDIFVLNSLWEGTPNVVLEAMACGCPVIATDVGDVSRYVISGITGWLIPPNDPDALCATLESASCLGEQELRAMGTSGRQHLLDLKMDSSDMARCYENVYDQLQINKHGAKSSALG